MSIDEMERVPHHLVDQYSPSEPISTGEYCTKAAEIIRDIISRNKVNATKIKSIRKYVSHIKFNCINLFILSAMHF